MSLVVSNNNGLQRTLPLPHMDTLIGVQGLPLRSRANWLLLTKIPTTVWNKL